MGYNSDDFYIEIVRHTIKATVRNLEENGLLKRNALRDFEVRKRYNYLVKVEKLSAKEARAKIAETRFEDDEGNPYYLTDKTIQHIVYPYKGKK